MQAQKWLKVPVPMIDVVDVIGVLCGRAAPRYAVEDHGVINDARRPDVDPPGVVRLARKFLRRDIRLCLHENQNQTLALNDELKQYKPTRATKTFGLVRFLLPTSSKHIRDAEIRDFQVTCAVNQQILRFQVSANANKK